MTLVRLSAIFWGLCSEVPKPCKLLLNTRFWEYEASPEAAVPRDDVRRSQLETSVQALVLASLGRRPSRLGLLLPVHAEPAAHPADGAMDGGEGSGRDRRLAAVVVTEISGPGAATVVESIPVDGPLPPVGTTAAGSIAVNLPSIAEALLHQFGGPVPAPAVRIQNGDGFFLCLLHSV